MEMTAIRGSLLVIFPPLSLLRPATALAAQAVAGKRCVIGWILAYLHAKSKFFLQIVCVDSLSGGALHRFIPSRSASFRISAKTSCSSMVVSFRFSISTLPSTRTVSTSAPVEE